MTAVIIWPHIASKTGQPLDGLLLWEGAWERCMKGVVVVVEQRRGREVALRWWWWWLMNVDGGGGVAVMMHVMHSHQLYVVELSL